MDVLFRSSQDTQRSINLSTSYFRSPRRSSDTFEHGFGELYICHLESPIKYPSKPNSKSPHKRHKLTEDICKGHMLIRIQKKVQPSYKSSDFKTSARSHTAQTYYNNLVRVTKPEFPVRKILRLPARKRLIEKDLSFTKEDVEMMNYPYKFIKTHRKSSPISLNSMPKSLRSSSPIISRPLKDSPSIITSPQTPVSVSRSFQGSSMVKLDVLGKSIRMSKSENCKRICRNRTIDSTCRDKSRKTHISMFLPSTEGIYLDNN